MEVTIQSPFPIECLPRLWSWIEPFRGRVADDFSPANLSAFVAAMETRMSQQTTWGVYGDGELGGVITYDRLSPWLGTAHLVLKPDFQGKGVAPKACRLAIAEMFATGIGKLAFYPLAGNKAIGSLLVHLGARREGTLREQTLCGGKPHDINVYGMTVQEFENANRNSSRTVGVVDHRSGVLDRGERPVGGVENIDQHQHPDVIAGTAGSPVAAARV